MLRVFFRNNRRLLKKLCRIANECLLEFLRQVTHRPDGQLIRNPFSEQKMTYNEENGTVIYRSRMHAKTKRNFEIFSAEDFIAAITQHIPDKGFQTCTAVAMGRQGRRRMERYYGWYSNRARGERAKKQAECPEGANPTGVQVIDVSDYQPRRLPSKKWRELIKKVWELDPMNCPQCGSEMRMVALIDDNEVIEKILRHLDLWPEEALPARATTQANHTGLRHRTYPGGLSVV